MKNPRSLIVAAVMTIALLTGAFVLIAMAFTTDNRIKSSAKNSYVYKTYLKDDAITIKSKDGVVTLTGCVDEESHKALARETVANLPGVKSVDDQLTLKCEIPAENSDGWIAMKVKAALLLHRNVNALKTNVDVKKGVVTLSGEALSGAQKELTGEYARDVSGVTNVRNKMTVVKAPNDGWQTWNEIVDDASVGAQVKVTLFFHRSTSAVHTDIAVRNGVVTISGKARNNAEKELVGKLAKDVKGVNSVVNNMAVE